MRQYAIPLLLSIALPCRAGDLAGKYFHEATDMNVTGTHSHVDDVYVVLTAGHPTRATVGVTDNGDLIGGGKEIFRVVPHGSAFDFVYQGCVSQASVRDTEGPCTSSEPPGGVRYRFRVSARGLVLVESFKGGILRTPLVLKKVVKFWFE